jgi:MoaA/NifB/PqqE/SkfB family radical SAM enzyme
MTNQGAISDPPRDPYHALLESARRQRQLFSVHWELTYRCNERCSHCYLDVLRPGDNVPGELSTDECLGIVDQLDANGVLNLAFSGGEVLTRPDFFTIAEYAHAKRFVLRIFTNGLNITSVVADRLAALHPYAVEIS